MTVKTMNYWPETGLMMDWSGMGLDDAFLNSMEEKIAAAAAGMKELEGGALCVAVVEEPAGSLVYGVGGDAAGHRADSRGGAERLGL